MLLNDNTDNYIFDLYGTLIDVHTDENAPQTWKKWYKSLKARGLTVPEYYVFRRDFFELDGKYRKEAMKKGQFSVPEIDIIPVYRELFIKYGNTALTECELYDIAYEFRVASRHYIRLFPGVKESLRQIEQAGKHAYILSNAQRAYTMPEIQLFGLENMVTDILISSDWGCMKPDRAFFDILIDRYNMDRKRTVMHGDSMSSDIEGAVGAGIGYVHLKGANDPNVFYCIK